MTVHEVTIFTPSFVMTGWEVNLPLDVMLAIASPDDKVCKQTSDRLQTYFLEVPKSLQRFREQQSRYYNLSSHGEQHRPGDMVYLREKTRKKQMSSKLMPKWKGSYMALGQCTRS